MRINLSRNLESDILFLQASGSNNSSPVKPSRSPKLGRPTGHRSMPGYGLYKLECLLIAVFEVVG